MQIAGNCQESDVQDAGQVIDGLTECVAGSAVLQVSDMLAEKGLLTLCQTDRTLQLGPDRQVRRRLEGELYRPRSVTTGPPVEERLALEDSHDRVVAAHMDGAV